MKNKALMILGGVAVLLLVIAISVSTTQQQSVEDEIAGKKYLTELVGKVNDVTQIEVHKGSDVITVYKKDKGWFVKQRNDYPADFSHVKKLLLALSDLETIEPKTKKPEKYEKLGVQDPASGTDNRLVIVSDANQQAIASIIIGNTRANGVYVRRKDDTQAWLVKGHIDTPSDTVAWLDKTIVDIKASEVMSFSINTSKIEKIIGKKEKPDDKDYVLENLPKGKELKSASALNSLAGNLRGLNFNDVKQAAAVDVSKATSSKVEYVLFTGAKIKATISKLDDKDYIRLEASSDVETAKQQVNDLNTRWQGWIYEIPSFKADSLRKKRSDILK